MARFDPEPGRESREQEQAQEQEQEQEQEREQAQEETTPYTPASFEKRTAAWMGLAYVLILLFAVTFSIFTGGSSLPGTFPLFLVPVAVAAAVIAIYRQRRGTAPGGMVLTVIIVVICAAAVALGLLLGVPALVSALTHPHG